MKKVVLGGTFDILHKGHEALLKKAFELGKVTIGLTSNKFAQKLKKRRITPFKERKKNLENFVKEKFSKRVRIIKINDIFGPTLKEDFDFIVVSEETFKNALKINQKRKKLKKPEIKIVKIEMILAEDKKPISCARIREGEIDKEGRKCIFCKIVEREIKALRIFENKKFLAFLDKNPRNLGHTLVIPKKHFRFIWDIPYIDEFFKFAKKIVKAQRKAFDTDWIIAPVLGDEIWHAHLHLIPRFKGNGFHFIPPKIKKLPQNQMRKIQQKIKKFLKS
jgi:pantetheine-phosphate adenylyltransferase